jgi:hypothetical protein
VACAGARGGRNAAAAATEGGGDGDTFILKEGSENVREEGVRIDSDAVQWEAREGGSDEKKGREDG